MGTANPTPCASLALAVTIPTTRPEVSSSGPPLFPGLIAASVWIMPDRWRTDRVEASATSMERPSPETIPSVTVSVNVPSGLPIATTTWPTTRSSAVARVAGTRPVASARTTARS